MHAVPRFFPKPSLYRDRTNVTFRPMLLRQTLMDGLVFFIAYPAVRVHRNRQEVRLLPVVAAALLSRARTTSYCAVGRSLV